MAPSKFAVTVVMLVAGATTRGADGLVTVRFGEQETCKVRGVTTIDLDDETNTHRLRFDLSNLSRETEVAGAKLKIWVDSAHTNVRGQWGFELWRDDPGFDGFKVYQGPQPDGAKLLDVKFPYNIDTIWLCEFDVSRAVRAWISEPERNQGLATNFMLPHTLKPTNEQPAWQLPYLEITYASENRDRPQQPVGLTASYRAGQVFLTWKQPKSPAETAFFDQAYRVYRHTRPITAAILHEAELLGEVHRNSQLNYRRSLVSLAGSYGPWLHYAKARGVVKFGERTNRDTLNKYYEAMPKRFNFVIDHGWLERFEAGRWAGKVPDDFANKKQEEHFARVIEGPQLSDDVGLFVHTVCRAGPAWYAVTSVLEGNENRRDFSAGNALGRPIDGKVERPRPVLQALFVAHDTKGPGELRKRYVCEYAYWEGGDGRFHTEPSTPLCFCFSVPTSLVGLGPAWNENTSFPPWITSNAQLAGYSCHYWNFRGNAIRTDTRYLPPTRIAPFPPSNIGGNMGLWMGDYPRFYHGSRKPPAADESSPQPNHNVRDVYGYLDAVGTAADPRKSTVQPFVETRQLYELDFVLDAFPADPNFVVLDGESSCFNMAVHYPDRFACVDAAQEKPWTSEAGEQNAWRFSGLKVWQLNNDRGVNVWQWNDPIWQSQQYPEREWPFLSVVQSDNYDASDNWSAQGYPTFLLDLVSEKRAGHWWWVDIGDAPDGEFMAIPRNQAVPALANATCCQVPLADWHDEPRGTLNGYIEWHRPTRPFVLPFDTEGYEGTEPLEPPEDRPFPYKLRHYEKTPQVWSAVSLALVDEPERFEMALRIREEGRMLNGQSVPPCPVRCGRVDVTPRRLQGFRTVKGKKYAWKNVRVATGQLLQAGVVQTDSGGLLTVPQMLVDKDYLGNKLVIEPADGKPVPRVDQNQTVVINYFETTGDRRQFQNMQTEELAYADYVARCTAPEMIKVVRDGREFTPKDFANGRRDGQGYSMWGSAKWDDTFFFPEDGRYRIEVDTTEAYFQNGAWPILDISVGDDHEQVYLDSPDPITTVRWFDVEAGRHRVAIRSPNNTFHEPFKHGDQSPERDRGFTLKAVRLFHVPEQPDSRDTRLVTVDPRAAQIGVGMPLWLGGFGVGDWHADFDVAWSVGDGATVSAKDVFTASKPGAYMVIATSGTKSDRVEITVDGDAWSERFDDQWPDGWQLHPNDDSAKLSARWWHLDLRPGTKPAMAVYVSGNRWADYTFTADMFAEREHFTPCATRGVVFRYANDKNYYRFERAQIADSAGQTVDVCRLMRTAEGKETELARSDTVPPPLVLSGAAWESYPSNSIAGEGRFQPRTPRGVIERYEVQVKGRSIICKLNGKTVLTADDDGPSSGTAGVCCAGDGSGVLFDNLEVRLLR